MLQSTSLLVAYLLSSRPLSSAQCARPSVLGVGGGSVYVPSVFVSIQYCVTTMFVYMCVEPTAMCPYTSLSVVHRYVCTLLRCTYIHVMPYSKCTCYELLYMLHKYGTVCNVTTVIMHTYIHAYVYMYIEYAYICTCVWLCGVYLHGTMGMHLS